MIDHYEAYFETATFDKELIYEGVEIGKVLLEAESAYQTMKILKKADLLKKVVCVRIYEIDTNGEYEKLSQFGPI